MNPQKGTVWPPAGSIASVGHQRGAGSTLSGRGNELHRGQRSSTKLLALALAVVRNLRATAAALARRLILGAGWWLAALAHRRRGSGGLEPLQRRLPFALRRWHLLLASALGYKLLRAGAGALLGSLNSQARAEQRRLKQQMAQATTYRDWSQAAVQLDSLTTRKCQADKPKQLLSQRHLEQRAATLARLRQGGDIFGLMFALRVDYQRQAGTTTSSSLLEAAGHCPVVPPAVQLYIDEVKECLRHIATHSQMPLDDRLAFLRELRHAYGRTGLVLSGGGSFGFWHFGVVRALLDLNLLPRVVSGSSAGSIGGALLCTRTDAEVHELVDDFPNTAGLDFFANNNTSRILRHLIQSGHCQDHEFFQGKLRRLLGDLTFADAYQRTGRSLSIAVTAADTQEPSRLLNYLTAPNVLIWSAVACSSAFPFLFAAQDLMAKDSRGNIVKFSEMGAAQSQRRWRDGSLEEDLPMRGLSQQFNATFFLVSQCNPWLIPMVALKNTLPTRLGKLLEGELKHRCQQMLAVWPNSPVLKMLSQPWEGDVTMVLPHTAFPVSKAAVNFSPDDIWEAMREGRQAVWAKVPAIQAACAIEVCIDELLHQVTRQVRQQHKLEKAVVQRQQRAVAGLPGRLRASLPSWLHMPSLGLPAVDSSGSFVGSMTPSHSTPNLPGAAAAEAAAAAAEASTGLLSTATGPAGGAGAAAAAEGVPAAAAQWLQHEQQQGQQVQQQQQGQGMGKQRRAGSRLSRHTSSTSASSSREGSRHADTAAGIALGIPLVTAEEGQAAGGVTEGAAATGAAAAAAEAAAAASYEEAASEAGVQATAGALALAGIEAAAEVALLPELEPGTPAVGEEAAGPEEPPLFDSPSEAWKDLALLGGIIAAAGGQGQSLDVFAC